VEANRIFFVTVTSRKPVVVLTALIYRLSYPLSTLYGIKFYILLKMYVVMILGKWPTWRKILYYVFISILYMFRATPCSSSRETFVSILHLVYVTLCRWPFRVQVGREHIPEVVLIQLILLMVSMGLLETC